MRKFLAAGMAVLALTIYGTGVSFADNGDCGQPQSTGKKPNTSDALFTLRVAVGSLTCPMWVCNVDNNSTISAGDALRILKFAVGQPVELICPDEPTTTTTTSSTTTLAPTAFTWTRINEIFAASCAGEVCHAPGNQGGQTDVDDYDKSYAELVNADAECVGTAFEKRVLPGDPANSFLMAKLDGTADCKSEVGSYTMPMLADQLSQEVRDGIRAWIAEGAPKN